MLKQTNNYDYMMSAYDRRMIRLYRHHPFGNVVSSGDIAGFPHCYLHIFS